MVCALWWLARRVICRGILCAVVLSLPLPALAERRMALVFGVNSYDGLRPLANALNDAEAMRSELQRLGFEVTLEPDRDLRRMRRALANFEEDAAGADLALVFFAGHGVELAGRSLLLPSDVRLESDAALTQSALALDDVAGMLVRAARVGVILLDACREDPFGPGATGAGRGAVPMGVSADLRPGLGRIGRIDGLVVGFAAAPGATASDGSGANSPFTQALLRHLATPGLELRSALTLVQQDVYDRTRAQQLPYVEAALPAAVFLAPDDADLPERARLLLAMAGLSDALRAEVEAVAEKAGVPLAPLYAVLLAAGGEAGADRGILEQAATEFLRARQQLVQMRPVDPEAQRLSEAAREALELGALDEARALVERAIEIDASAGDAAIEVALARRLSEAEGLLARADIVYLTAIGGDEFGPLDYIAAFADSARAFRRADFLHRAEGREMGLASLLSYETALERWQSLAARLLTHGAPPDRDAMLEGVTLWLDVLNQILAKAPPHASVVETLVYSARDISEAHGSYQEPWRWQLSPTEAEGGGYDFIPADRGLFATQEVLDLALGIIAYNERLLDAILADRFALGEDQGRFVPNLRWSLVHTYDYLATLHEERGETALAKAAQDSSEDYLRILR